ncbi:MAG: acylphosphatase [Chloroflexi bacterium]|nr:acylphosphatase [Chloroflexota bacterium]
MWGQSRVHVWVSGRVQGVGFRFATVETAQLLGLGGWVRNLGDGRVEAVFEGPAAVVAKAVAWCHRGPAGSWVSDIETRPEQPIGESSFRTRPTDYAGEG